MVRPLAVLMVILASATPIYWTSTENMDKFVKKNDMVLVEFWGTWCAACRQDFDKTLAVARKYPKAKIVMVALEDNKYDVRHFIRDKKIPKNVLIAIWRGRAPVKTVPRFRAYHKGKLLMETDSLVKMRKVLK